MKETLSKINAKLCFQDCSPIEIGAILARRHLYKLGQINELEYKKSLVILLVFQMNSLKFEKLCDEEKVRHINYIRWAITEKITNRPFDTLMIGGRKFGFPKDDFEDTTAIEYSVANMFYLSFVSPQNNAPDNLYNLLSVFVRPVEIVASKHKKVTQRIQYDTDTALEDAEFFKNNMPFGLVIAFLDWFEHNNNAFILKNEMLFEPSGGKQMFVNGEGWIAMLEDVAETGVYGNFELVCNQNLHTVFMYLRHSKIKLDKQIEDQKRQNND